MSFWLTRMSATALVSISGVVAIPAYVQAAQSPTPVRLEELPPQVRAYANRVLAHHTHIDGAVTPERLSLSDLLRGRLSSIPTALGGQLTQADEEAITRFAKQEDAMLAQVRVASSVRVERFCATRERSAGQLAAGWNDLQQQEEAELNRFYEDVLDALSVEGRHLVRRYLSEQIAPRTRKSVVELDRMAVSMPDQVIAQFDRYCVAPSGRPTSIEIQDQPRTGNGALTTYGQ